MARQPQQVLHWFLRTMLVKMDFLPSPLTKYTLIVRIIKLALLPIQKYWMTWNHQRNSWKKFMGELWKKWMNCSCKLIVKTPFLALIFKAKASILILPKFKPKRWFLFSWWYWISWLDNYNFFLCKLMVLWGYSPYIYSQTRNWKSKSEIYKCEFVKQVVSRWLKLWKKSVCWVCVFTQKGHIVDILPYS